MTTNCSQAFSRLGLPRQGSLLVIRASGPGVSRGRGGNSMKSAFPRAPFSSTGRGKMKNKQKTKAVLPKSVFLDQQGEKGTFKLKTRVLEALGLQGGSFSDASGGHFGALAIAFSPSGRRKRHISQRFASSKLSFSPQGEGKGNSELPPIPPQRSLFG